MKLFYQAVVILSLLTLVGVSVYIAAQLKRLNDSVDSVKGEVPMSMR